MIEQCRAQGLLKAGARQRTDSTHVLASTRTLRMLELIGETLRAALNEIATVEPQWLQGVTPPRWHDLYDKRVEDTRLPRSDKERGSMPRRSAKTGSGCWHCLKRPRHHPR